MKTIFDTDTRKELLERLNQLTAETKPHWGKMNSAQMLTHCVRGIQSPLGEIPLTPPPLIIRIIGPLFKRQVFSPGTFNKNSPTGKEFLIVDQRDFLKEKTSLINCINKVSDPLNIKVHRHGFFGKLTNEEWGALMYKHLNHHFIQFGV